MVFLRGLAEELLRLGGVSDRQFRPAELIAKPGNVRMGRDRLLAGLHSLLAVDLVWEFPRSHALEVEGAAASASQGSTAGLSETVAGF